MVAVSEMMFIVGLIGILLAFAIPTLRRQKVAGFVAASILVTGVVFGGLAWAGLPAFIQIDLISPPVAGALFEAVILDSSDTDRTEAGESIAAGGHQIQWTLSDAQLDGLGDVNLDIRVSNLNVGDALTAWAFESSVTYVSTLAVSNSGASTPIVNLTDYNTRYDITWTGTETGAPTFEQVGEKVISRDFRTGIVDILNADLRMNPTATALNAAGNQLYLRFSVGGIALEVILLESV